MIKDLLAESAKQFEELYLIPAEWKTDCTGQVKAHTDGKEILVFLSTRISSAFALGEQSGIQKAVEAITNFESSKVMLNLLGTKVELTKEKGVEILRKDDTLALLNSLQSKITTHKEI